MNIKRFLTVTGGALFVFVSLTATVSDARQVQQDTTPKQDIKDAGSSAKDSAKKTGSATKKETKKVINKSAKKTEQGADKVEDKTKPKS
jgi:vacuolar-type H+-ATPase subunit H